MPGIMPRYAVNDKKINDSGDNERAERNKMIERAWNYYHGKHDDALASDGDTKQIILNLERQAIDRVTDMIGMPMMYTSQEGDQALEDLLQAIVELSDFEELVPDVLTAGQIEGHAFLRIIPPANGVISPQNPPMLGHLPAKYVTTYWDMGLFGMQQAALWYRLQWEDDVKRRQDIVPGILLPDDVRGGVADDQWVIIEYEYTNRAGGGWVEVARDVWGFPFAPIVDVKNARKPHSYYGQSEVEDTRLQDALNFIATNTGKIIKAHAHPMGFAKGFQPPQETKIGGVYYIPDPEGDFKLVEMQGDLQSSMNFLAMLRQAFFSEARVTDPAVIKDKIGAATNFTMRMMYSDMIDQVQDKRKRYGRLLSEALRRVLFMMGIDVEVQAKWGDLLPVNQLELVQRLQVEDALGITSKQMMAEELGRDYEMVVEQKQEESVTDIDRQVGLLTGLAERGVVNGGF
jgi:hypothetical protein